MYIYTYMAQTEGERERERQRGRWHLKPRRAEKKRFALPGTTWMWRVVRGKGGKVPRCGRPRG